MSNSMFKFAGGAVLAVAFALPAAAQEDPNLTGALPAQQQRNDSDQPQNFGAFGSGVQEWWIAAPEFTALLTAGSPPLSYAGFHYYTSSGSANPVGYFAQVPLPSGAQIASIQCYVNDSSATHDVPFSFQKYDHNTSTNTPSTTFALSFSSTGATGFQQPSLTVSAADGAVRYTVGNDHYLYYIRADLASDTSLRGCNVRWSRTVSPAPVSATFPNDVPTTSGFFRFVEAMAASGLTGGCATGSFCPNDPVTRGQMAVFLSVALGLHFPQ